VAAKIAYHCVMRHQFFGQFLRQAFASLWLIDLVETEVQKNVAGGEALGAKGDALAVGGERHSVDFALLAFDAGGLLAGPCIPDADGAVLGTGDRVARVGSESHAAHGAVMALHACQFVAAAHGIPDPNSSVGAAGDDPPAIWSVRHSPNEALMARK